MVFINIVTINVRLVRMLIHIMIAKIAIHNVKHVVVQVIIIAIHARTLKPYKWMGLVQFPAERTNIMMEVIDRIVITLETHVRVDRLTIVPHAVIQMFYNLQDNVAHHAQQAIMSIRIMCVSLDIRLVQNVATKGIQIVLHVLRLNF